ncbi:MAG: hypothetical protein M2R45_00536 [Verrucomicrobia subdivision 3 bacterium]|nr:hypothetical protein [Limisphaerales bacterium]MCS1413586.1 hypothetical protein [Limisphaerales bacterium]
MVAMNDSHRQPRPLIALLKFAFTATAMPNLQAAIANQYGHEGISIPVAADDEPNLGTYVLAQGFG